MKYQFNKKYFDIANLKEESDEKKYWLSRTPMERLEALEYYRQVIYGYDPASSRLQRFFEIVQRKSN